MRGGRKVFEKERSVREYSFLDRLAMKTKTYTIDASETVFYTVDVKAKSEEEAREAVMNGEIDMQNDFDSADFQIDSITEKTS